MYFKVANGWNGPEQSKSRIGPALQAAGVTAKQVEKLFEVGTASWKQLSLSANVDLVMDLKYNTNEAAEFKVIVAMHLRRQFPEVFERQSRGEEEEKFINDRAPAMITYRTWHYWSRNERKRIFRNGAGDMGTGTMPIAINGGDTASTMIAGDVSNTTSFSDRERSAAINSTGYDNVTTGSPGTESFGHDSQDSASYYKQVSSATSTASSVDTVVERPLIIEIHSAEDRGELLRVDIKHILNDNKGREDPVDESSSLPNFERLRALLRDHPLVSTVSDDLLFIHVYAKDKNAFVFDQATLETAFEEWKWAWSGSRQVEFRLYVVSVIECFDKPPKIKLTS